MTRVFLILSLSVIALAADQTGRSGGVVSILFTEDTSLGAAAPASHRCSGHLLSPVHVLTSAHCVYNKAKNSWFKSHRVLHLASNQSRAVSQTFVPREFPAMDDRAFHCSDVAVLVASVPFTLDEATGLAALSMGQSNRDIFTARGHDVESFVSTGQGSVQTKQGKTLYLQHGLNDVAIVNLQTCKGDSGSVLFQPNSSEALAVCSFNHCHDDDDACCSNTGGYKVIGTRERDFIVAAVSATSSTGRHSLLATTTSVCGNNITEQGEECDGEACCNTNCRIITSFHICHLERGNNCWNPVLCPGNSSQCPDIPLADQMVRNGTACALDPPKSWYCAAGACVSTETGKECGNGIVEEGEDCEGGDCCSPACQFRPLGITCRPQFSECDLSDICYGNSSICIDQQRLNCPADTSGAVVKFGPNWKNFLFASFLFFFMLLF